MNKSLESRAKSGDESAIVLLVQKLNARTLNVQATALSSLVRAMIESDGETVIDKVMEQGAMGIVMSIFEKMDITLENEQFIMDVMSALALGFGNRVLAQDVLHANTFFIKKAVQVLKHPFLQIPCKAMTAIYSYSTIATRLQLEELVRMDIFREAIPNLLAHPCYASLANTLHMLEILTNLDEGVEAVLDSVKLLATIKTILEEEEIENPKLGTCLHVINNMIQSENPEHRAELVASGFVPVLKNILDAVENDNVEMKSSMQHMLQMLGSSEA